MTTMKKPPKPQTMKGLREQVRAAELEVALAEANYTKRVLKTLTEADEIIDTERAGWDIVASAGRTTDMKDLTGPGVEIDLATVRKRSYRAWRLDPHGRGILRNLLRFVVGRELTLDFGDTRRGVWTDGVLGGTVTETKKDGDRLLTRLVWDEFVRRNAWKLRVKELVRRTLRDGDMFLRRFVSDGHVAVRFIEADAVASPTLTIGGTVRAEDVPTESWPLTPEHVGKKTRVIDGVEVLATDVETVVAYHVRQGDPLSVSEFERVPAKDVIHLKCSADFNDARGTPFLEPVLRKLAQYDTWEEYRVILNKIRTAIALVRKIEGGTAAQAQAIIAGRQPAPGAPLGRDPQTTSGRREAAFRPGTILTPSAGVSYDFISPRLDARDASEDGRKLLLTIAVGAGMPEMLVTGDFSNSNFASTSVAAKLVQREWEDWQDFFESALVKVYEWVLEAAVEGLKLPANVDRSLTIQWPVFMRDDETRATDRRATLWQSGILSKRTWAAEEGYVYDDEKDLMADEEPPETPADADAEGSVEEARVQTAHAALLALGELDEATTRVQDPDVAGALTRYVERARDLLLAEQRSTTKVQTLIFDKSKFDAKRARKWARAHGFRASKTDETEGSIRLRQASPGRFKDGSFRTISLTKGVQAVVAHPK